MVDGKVHEDKKTEKKVDAVMAALSTSTTPLQAIVTAHEATHTDLYAQLATLKEQIRTLQQQRIALEKQLRDSEPEDVTNAREALRTIEMVRSGAMRHRGF